ncbi:hypothetical protein VaNZ11_010629, partial [Volvox africanus]
PDPDDTGLPNQVSGTRCTGHAVRIDDAQQGVYICVCVCVCMSISIDQSIHLSVGPRYATLKQVGKSMHVLSDGNVLKKKQVQDGAPPPPPPSSSSFSLSATSAAFDAAAPNGPHQPAASERIAAAEGLYAESLEGGSLHQSSRPSASPRFQEQRKRE